MKPNHLSPHLEALIAQTQSAALKRQFLASSDEEQISPYDSRDPLAENAFSATAFLIHRYRTKALWLTTPHCGALCRYCFRKHRLAELKTPQPNDIEEACRYLTAHPEIQEILLSGGDPLTLSDDELLSLLQRFSSIRPLRFRLCTRMPVSVPGRVSESLLKSLQGYNLRFSLHINSVDELTFETVTEIKKIRSFGFPILTQTVLLNGVNDSVKALQTLFQRFLDLDLTPYYLFQGDLAAETVTFRVSIQRGRKLYRQVRQRMKGKPLPRYAVDLPQGGGKVPIELPHLVVVKQQKILFAGDGGRLFGYPIE